MKILVRNLSRETTEAQLLPLSGNTGLCSTAGW
jgi:hypothetical protein